MVTMTDNEPSTPAIVELDITADTCPLTFVRTRLALDSMAPEGVLVVRLKGRSRIVTWGVLSALWAMQSFPRWRMLMAAWC